MGRDAGEETREIERGWKELGVTWANVDRRALGREAGACLWCLRPPSPSLFRGGGGGGGGIYADAP